MPKLTPSHLRTLRTVLLITDAVGLVFAFLTSLLLGGAYSFIILFLSLSGLFNVWVRHTETEGRGYFQLPLSPTNADADVHSHSQSYRTGLRQGFIALGDFMSGTFLLAFHIVYIVLGHHDYGVGVLSLYAVFAMLGAAAMHFVLGLGHFRLWREERGRKWRGGL